MPRPMPAPYALRRGASAFPRGAWEREKYVTPGTHRTRIDPYEGAVIRLGETEMSVLPLNWR